MTAQRIKQKINADTWNHFCLFNEAYKANINK